MKPSHLAVTVTVAALCTGILVLFTDLELSVVRWFNCGPLSSVSEDQSEVCKRQL